MKINYVHRKISIHDFSLKKSKKKIAVRKLSNMPLTLSGSLVRGLVIAIFLQNENI